MGGRKTSPFNLVVNGSSNVGQELWVDLGLIQNGNKYQVGKGTFTSTDKTIGCEIRINPVGQSAGTLAATTLVGSCSVRIGNTGTIDCWRNGRLNITAPTNGVSTGVEHWWVRFTSRSGALGSMLWNVTYLEL